MEKVLEPALDKFLNEVSGLQGVIVSSSDAVCFGQAWKDREGSKAVASVLPFVAEQIGKLQWGPLRSLVAEYKEATVVQVNLAPLVLTFVGSKDLDVDVLQTGDMLDRLGRGFKPLQAACQLTA